MNEELQKALLEYLRQAVELGKEQVPLVIQEALRYGLIESSLYFIGLLLLGFFGFWMFKHCRAIFQKDDFEMFGIIGMACSAVAILFAFISSAHYAVTALKILIAPRLYLLERFVL